MNPTLAPEEEAFRERSSSFLAEFAGVDSFFFHEGEHDADVDRLYRALGERGWLVLAWPSRRRRARPSSRSTSSSCGTRWRTPVRPGRHSAPASSPRRSSPTAPEQKERFLPGLRRGRGLLLPRLLRARGGVRSPGRPHERCATATTTSSTGEKRWTCGGHRADYLWVLCRTGSDRGPVPRAEPADRRPAIARDLDLADPVARRRAVQRGPVRRSAGPGREQGRPGERGVVADGGVAGNGAARAVLSPGRVERDFEELRACARGAALDADPVVRARLADLAVEVAEVRVLSLVLLEAVEHGRPAVVEAACNKLAGSERANGSPASPPTPVRPKRWCRARSSSSSGGSR